MTRRSKLTSPARQLVALPLALVAVAGVAACGGGSDKPTAAPADSKTAGNGVDVAFADEMVAHHAAAVDMAKIARRQARTKFVKTLADDIVATQTSEMSRMRSIQRSLPNTEKANLGISMSDMGMSMDASMLEGAKPFDREFVDMMIPHHQGAIRMARVELRKGRNGSLRSIATAVVRAQTREIRTMNRFRSKQYGAPSPAGGVPAAAGSASDMEMEHHDG